MTDTVLKNGTVKLLKIDSIISTGRLILRKFTNDDFADLCEMLYDPDVMYAWEHTFSETQARELLERQFERYEETGVGFWAAIEKETGEMVGQIGLIWADINGEKVLELAYMLKKIHWHKGFAVEGGKACLNYAFSKMGVDKIYAPIRPENAASVKVAEKLGANADGECVKHYNGKDMLHLIYVMSPSKNQPSHHF